MSLSWSALKKLERFLYNSRNEVWAPPFSASDPDPNVFWHSSSISHVVLLRMHSLMSLHFVPSEVVPKSAGLASSNPFLQWQEYLPSRFLQSAYWWQLWRLAFGDFLSRGQITLQWQVKILSWALVNIYTVVTHHFRTLKPTFAFTFVTTREVGAISIGITVIGATAFVIIDTCDVMISVGNRCIFWETFIARTFITTTVIDTMWVVRTLNKISFPPFVKPWFKLTSCIPGIHSFASVQLNPFPSHPVLQMHR